MSLAMAMVSHHNFQNFVLNTYKTTISMWLSILKLYSVYMYMAWMMCIDKSFKMYQFINDAIFNRMLQCLQHSIKNRIFKFL